MQITGQRKKSAAARQKRASAEAVPRPSVPAAAAPPSAIRYVPQFGVPKKLRPGMVLVKGALDLRAQQRIIDESFRLGHPGEEHGGFFEVSGRPGVRPRLNQGHRGRLILPSDALSAATQEVCRSSVATALEADPSCQSMEPTTVLVNFYDIHGTFKWHRDTEAPDLVRSGRGKPIVSLSVGESCVFAFKDEYDQTDHSECVLESGDVLVFGGPSRLIVHSILKIIPGTRPPTLRWPHSTDGRLNLTFREVNGRIDKSAFPAYRVDYDIEEGPDEG
eukprot:TRINITY_DN27205_c0_g2_i1.p2 TRINITY_DN27205_c0_g2~~TRINITY_DN27205_c0_g2_i1.p2  ORF type:complete len:276 (+),score=67.24 TRINITY_DN27205_c0_g2_i1:72-899(+)